MSAFAWRCKTRGRSKLGQGEEAGARISVCDFCEAEGEETHKVVSVAGHVHASSSGAGVSHFWGHF